MKPLPLITLCALLSVVPAGHAAVPAPDGKPHKFELGDREFLLDGQPMLIAAGEMHFGRVLPQDWEARIKQARAMGLNTLSFYLFWNLCEPREGEFTFTGLTDVRRVLQLCQANGLWVILRPGPYCCAEVEYGGIPWWTAKYPDVKIRSTDATWLAWSRRYITQVAKQVADLQVSRGGPLLMVQMENEFGMVSGGNFDHLKELQRIFTGAGFEVPLFTCDPFLRAPPAPDMHPAGRFFRGRNGLRNDRDYEGTIAAIGNSPIFVPELYTAWFSGWGQPIATRNASLQQVVDWTTYLLDKKVSFCYYMFHGGTTYGFFNGTNEYLPVQTSYDYSAPVDEAGRVTPKYHALRQLLTTRLGVQPPAVPADPAVTTLPAIKLTPAQTLLDTVQGSGRKSDAPLAMEALDQAYGAVLYRKRFPSGLKGTLELREVMDYAIVLVNGRDTGRVFRGYGPDSNTIVLNEPGPVTLDLLVYNLGRISVIVSERTQSRARKGLVGGAWLDGVALTGWENHSLPLEKLPRFKTSTQPQTSPKFYRGTFQVDAPAGTFLDLRPWHFGVVWVNGHNLGRYWDRGALRSLFLPAAFLKKGKNEIVVLELHDAPSSAEIASSTKIIEEKAVPFEVVLDRPAPRPRPPAAVNATPPSPPAPPEPPKPAN